ncbi:MAG: aspartate kinase [Bacillota bacterium]|nr:aspartate kinase [Bacillota bacterium]
MALRVQKFGGSSVADLRSMRRAAERVVDAWRGGDRVVVVVSARGGRTDALLELAREITAEGRGESPDGRAEPAWEPPLPAADREIDALLATGEQESAALMALLLRSLGCPALSFTGWQAGVLTDGRHRAARVEAVATERLREALERGWVPVVTGFQGIDRRGDLTTLGRGGSDATAVVLAAALGADRCEIYSDVAGVYTADPRVVPDARPLKEISYDEMLELARLGAKVLQHRAVEYAREHGVVIEARSTFEEAPGTRVLRRPAWAESDRPVSGVTVDRKTAKIALLKVPDRPGVAAALFGALAERGVNVDMIIQSVSRELLNDIAFTVARDDLAPAREASEAACRQLGGEGILADAGVAKLSVVGAGMVTHPGVAATLFRALGESGINIEMIATSEISISCLIRAEHAEAAVRAVHAAFHLGREE